jgi:hypothetical protein
MPPSLVDDGLWELIEPLLPKHDPALPPSGPQANRRP